MAVCDAVSLTMKRLLCTAGLFAVAARAAAVKPDLPMVDLGYERHQAISYDVPESPPVSYV